MIDKEPLKQWINHFYGYGSWDAKIWFVAYEESGGDLPEEVAERLDYFSRTHISTVSSTLCDVRDLYQSQLGGVGESGALWLLPF